jgi:O-antigen ligase
MQISTDFSVPKTIQKFEQPLFWLIGFLSIACFCAAIFFNFNLLFVIPFAIVFVGLALLNFKILYFLLLIAMPMSIEFNIGVLGLDVPSEPIVMLLAASTFLFMMINKNNGDNSSFKHVISLIIIAQFLWSIYIILFSTDIVLSIKYLLAKAWYLLGFYAATMLLIKTEKDFKRFFWCLFIPTFISVIYVMLKHATLHFTFDNITKSVHPIYRNHVNYAVFITMILPFIFLAKSWYGKQTIRHKLLKYSIPIFLAAIYFSYTRGAWLATAAMVVYIIVIHFRITKLVLFVSFLSALSFSVYILSDHRYLKYSPDFEHTIYHDDLSEHLSSTFEMQDMSTVERFYRWIAAVKMVQKNPIVGVGPNNFVTNYKKYTVSSYETYISDNEERSTVHNYFLLLLTEQGFPALLLFVILIAAILITAENTYHKVEHQQKKYVLTITLCIVAFLINNSLSDLVEANKVGSLFLMCIGLLVNFSTSQMKIKPNDK